MNKSVDPVIIFQSPVIQKIYQWQNPTAKHQSNQNEIQSYTKNNQGFLTTKRIKALLPNLNLNEKQQTLSSSSNQPNFIKQERYIHHLINDNIKQYYIQSFINHRAQNDIMSQTTKATSTSFRRIQFKSANNLKFQRVVPTATTKKHLDRIKSLDEPRQNEQILRKKKKFIIDKNMLKLITAHCFVIFSVSQEQPIYTRRCNKVREIASLTKIMTCYTACKLLDKNQQDPKSIPIKVSRKAAQIQGTTANLKNSDTLTLNDLLYGMMLPSGNDAAYAIAEYFGKDLENGADNVSNFIILMNEYAKELQLESTHFANPHGLANSQNVSTALNISQLVFKAMQHPLFQQIVKTQTYRCQIYNENKKDYRDIIWDSTNKLLSRGDCLGVKTGVTNTAGPCYAGNFCNGDKNLIVVLLKTCGLEERFTEATHLYEYAKRRI